MYVWNVCMYGMYVCMEWMSVCMECIYVWNGCLYGMFSDFPRLIDETSSNHGSNNNIAGIGMNMSHSIYMILLSG